jgi:FkbM family methyltransferase
MKNPNAIISSDFGPIIININDKFIGRHISDHGYWAIDDINLIKLLIEHQLTKLDAITFYDVGANIGTHTLAISKFFSTRVTVRAFEAQRQIYNMLCGTIALNGLSNVYCYNNAVSDIDNSVIELHLPDYNSINNFGGFELISPQRSDNQEMIRGSTELIATKTIDSFNEKIDFIKMDIEGMEDKALAGAIHSIEKSRPICFLEVLKSDSNFIVNFFKSRNYIGFQKDNDLIAIPLEHQLKINHLSMAF